MIATLTFNLDEEKHQHECAVYGDRYRLALYDTLMEIRRRIKYEVVSLEQVKTLELIRDFILEQLEDVPFDR